MSGVKISQKIDYGIGPNLRIPKNETHYLVTPDGETDRHYLEKVEKWVKRIWTTTFSLRAIEFNGTQSEKLCKLAEDDVLQVARDFGVRAFAFPATIHGTPEFDDQQQLEAVQLFGDCEGNIAETGRRIGVDRKTVEQHITAAFEKMGKSVPNIARTKRLQKDNRGQEHLSDDDDHRQ